MMSLTKNTIFGCSIGSALALIVAVWILSSEVRAWMDKIEANTSAIAMLAMTVDLRGVNDEIGDLKKELRELYRALRYDPENDLILDQIADVEDAIEELENIRDCILAGNPRCE